MSADIIPEGFGVLAAAPQSHGPVPAATPGQNGGGRRTPAPATVEKRAHPALVELRQQRIAFACLVAQLGLPVGDQDAAHVKGQQQRRATRGVYGITGVAS